MALSSYTTTDFILTKAKKKKQTMATKTVELHTGVLNCLPSFDYFPIIEISKATLLAPDL